MERFTLAFAQISFTVMQAKSFSSSSAKNASSIFAAVAKYLLSDLLNGVASYCSLISFASSMIS